MVKKTSKKMTPNVSLNILNNKIVLYLVSLFSLFFVINKLLDNKFFDIFVFYLVTICMFLYTKNMTVVLIVALIGTYLFSSYKGYFVREGFKEGVDPDDNDDDDDDDDDDVDVDDDDGFNVDDDGLNIDDDDDDDVEMEGFGDDITTNFKEGHKKKQLKNKLKNKLNDKMNDLSNGVNDVVDRHNDKNKEKYQNYKKLGHAPVKIDNMPNVSSSKNKLTKADQMEQAYDNVEKIMGTDNMKTLGKTTDGLMKKQKELLSGIKDMTPILGDAMNLLNKLDLSKMGMGNSD